MVAVVCYNNNKMHKQYLVAYGRGGLGCQLVVDSGKIFFLLVLRIASQKRKQHFLNNEKIGGGGLWTDFVLLRFSKFNICDSAKRFIQKMFIKSTCYSIIQVLQRKHEFGLLIPLQLHVQSTTLALHVGQNLEQGEPNLLRQQDGSPIHPILGNFETKSLLYSNGEGGEGQGGRVCRVRKLKPFSINLQPVFQFTAFLLKTL